MTTPQSTTNELKPKTIEWLRDTVGLIALNSALRTGIHRFSIRSKDFYDNPDYSKNTKLLNKPKKNNNDNNGINRSEDFLDRYSQLRRGMLALGVSVNRTNGKKTIQREEYDGKYEEEIDETIIHCKLHVAFERTLYTCDIFQSLREESQNLIAELAIMDLLTGETKPLQQDSAVCRKRQEFSPEGNINYYELWSDDTYDIYPNEINYKFSIVHESDKNVVREITGGLWYNELRNLVATSSPNINREKGQPYKALPKRFQGLCKTKWEVKMAELLTDRGYFVILEPNLIMPENILDTRRQPDIMVCKKGRMMAIEIDDSSHLIRGKDGKGSGYPNTIKYKRDRDQDRVLLSNGIPVIRVFFEEFRDSPHQIVSDLEGMYEGLGGARFTFM